MRCVPQRFGVTMVTVVFSFNKITLSCLFNVSHIWILESVIINPSNSGFQETGRSFQVYFKFCPIFFRSLELTSTLTITKCLLRSAISCEFAKSGFNAENKKQMLDC